MFFPKKQDSSVAFVCHANLIRYFISRYFLLDRAQWQNLWLGNCSISTLKFHDKSNVELDLLAFEEHIPRHL
ncbi:histidine phosphatase family protein [Agarilytica rhodophyticola]|uniref:histidine phosphatase family protein n=1 Tax=Agarilytica rhodophyticola TaxID=1737490 RepID=UPI00131A1855